MKPKFVLAYALIVACSTLTAWSAWDRGGGYYSTQMIVALSLLPLGLLAILLLAEEQPGNAGGVIDRFLVRMKPPVLVSLAIAIWALASLQTLPLSRHVTTILLPAAAETKSELLPTTMLKESTDTGRAELFASTDEATDARLSVSPTYTRVALLQPAAFAVMVWICFLCFRFPSTMVVFLFVIAGAGAVFSFFGLIDTIRLVRDWQVELRQMLLISPVGADDPFGPFVNNNNASGFLCLAIGCAIGLFVLCEQASSLKSQSDADARSRFFSGLIIGRLVSLALIVTLVVGVIGSNSRGGFLGLLAGSLVVLAFLLPKLGKLKFALVFGAAALFSWLVISGLGFGARSTDRFATLLDDQIMEDPRLDHWSDALVAAGHYLPFGSGLGTYRYAYLPFQKNGAPLWFVNADGMAIEWLVEGGVWLLPLVVFGLIVLVRHVRRIGSGLKTIERKSNAVELSGTAATAVTYAKCVWAVGLFSIPALLVTQCFDFGITLMPLLLTFAGISGAILRMSATVAELNDTELGTKADVTDHDGCDSRAQPIFEGGPFTRIGQSRCMVFFRQASGPALLVLLTIGLAMSAKELYVASVAEDEVNFLRREREQRLLADMSDLTDRLDRLANLASANPDNAMVWKALGEMRLAEQQRLGALRLFELQPDTVDSHISWLLAKTVRHASYGAEGSASFRGCLLPTQSADEYLEARRDFSNALLLNPLDPSVRLSLVELDMVAPGLNLASRDLLLQAARLRPRSESFLQYLLWLAADYPGVERVPEITAMREALRQERLSNSR